MTPENDQSAAGSTPPAASAAEACVQCGVVSDSLLFSDAGLLCDPCLSEDEVKAMKQQGIRYDYKAGVAGVVIGIVLLAAAAYILAMILKAHEVGVSARSAPKLLILLGIGGVGALVAGGSTVRAARGSARKR